MHNMKFTVSFLLVLTLFHGPIWCQRNVHQAQHQICYTPENYFGICVGFTQCQSLVEYYGQNKDSQEAVQYLNQVQRNCSSKSESNDQVVCCAEAYNNYFLQKPHTGNGDVILNGPECGLSSEFTSKKVVGGEPAKIGAWPWITLLGYGVSEISPFMCGGSLITKRHVITAAHCVKSDLKFVRLGEHDLGSSTETTTIDINVVRKYRHPKYNPRNGKNDIGILYLETAVSYTERIHPVCIPKDPPLRTQSFVDYELYVAGWGRTQEGGKSAEVLQQLPLPVWENDVCRDKYSSQRRLNSKDQFDEATICAGILTGGMDTCQGDSGGPLMYPQKEDDIIRFYLIGVVSYGIGCARADIPGVYTNVANFIDWIEQKIVS